MSHTNAGFEGGEGKGEAGEAGQGWVAEGPSVSVLGSGDFGRALASRLSNGVISNQQCPSI